ncbi:MAG TPA: hypothetical protein VJ464_15280 [Blastocatellia bacterium]|nr:hypothetical protein [Blastocatellia bacterium]
MKRLFASLIVALFAAQLTLAHDPRTVAKNLSHTLSIEGAGKLTLSYKSLHYNEQGFSQRKTERAMTTFNRLWKSIGKLDADFDVVIGGVTVPKGSYTLGFNYDADDNYKLVLSGGGKDIMIPMTAAMDGPSVNYLSFDVRPENDTDTFAVEVRYGKLRTAAEMKVPYLAPHEHEKPAEKKP